MSNIRSIAHSNLLHHLIRPARGGAGALIVVFAILMSVSASAGLLGMPLGLILLSWFFKYAYILFDHVVRGVDDPPTLDIQMVNPLNEQRPLAQLVILGALAAGLYFAWINLPPALTYGLAALVALVLPASVAVLGLESNPLKAINPIALARMIAGLGLMYAAVLVLIALYFTAFGLLGRLSLWLPVRFAATMFATLSLFSALAGAL